VRGFEPVPLDALIDDVVIPARRHFPALVLPIGLPLAAVSVAWNVFWLRWLGTSGFAWPGESVDAAALAPWLGWSSLLLGFYGLAFSVTTVAAMDAVSGRPIDVRRAWGFVLRPVVLATLFAVLAVSLASLLFCAIPALYVVPALSFVLPAMADEDLGGWAAIRRSWVLAHHNPSGRLLAYPWVQVSVVLFVGTVVLYALTLAVQLPFVVIQQYLMLRQVLGGGAPDVETVLAGQTWIQIPLGLVGAVSTTAGWLYLAFGTTTLFAEVRRRREGADLVAAVAELERRSPRSATPGSGVEDGSGA